MISSDNIIMLGQFVKNIFEKGGSIISYLPTSHIASLTTDVALSFCNGVTVYFAD